jgi:hypothetical protein
LLGHRWGLSGACPVMRADAARAQKERELISERTRAALAATRARGAMPGQDREGRPPVPLCAPQAAWARQTGASQTVCRLVLETEALKRQGVSSHSQLARALVERGVLPPNAGITWIHTTVARILARARTAE